MRLQDQLCPELQARKLMKLGVVQDGQFSWLFSPSSGKMEISHLKVEALELLAKSHPKSIEWKERTDVGIFSAFSCAELGLALPDLLETHLQYELVCIKEPDEWLCRYVRNNDMLDMHPSGLTGCATTEAEARAEMLISLLDNNIITVEEVNHRLSPSSDK